jgi:NADH:ubiquinone oxidoreductase subunit 6 (subunit J)
VDVIRDVLFWALSALAVWSGWRVFRVDSMIRATFSLLVSFVCVGGIGLLLSAPYIGVATVFMMAVEMMVMGLFMVAFMMNPAGLNPMSMVHQHRLSIAAGVLAFATLAAAAIWSELPSDPVPADARVVHDLGIELLGDSMLIFETAGVTLLATMLGAVILSSRRGRFGEAFDGAVPPGLEPGGAPAGRVPDDSGGHHMHHGHGGHEHGGHGGDPHGGGQDDGAARGEQGHASSDTGASGDVGNGDGHGGVTEGHRPASHNHGEHGGGREKGGMGHERRHGGERA